MQNSELTVMQHRLAEISFETSKPYANPFKDVTVHAEVTEPDGVKRNVPGFWAGGGIWRVRLASSKVGAHAWRIVCSDEGNADLHGREGIVHVTPYTGDNPLYIHGPLKRNPGARYPVHADGTPFLWLGDTWWMGLTKRLQWPGEFDALARDRKEKGFTVVQIVAGLYPDMGAFDERGANEAGYPWDEGFQSINPEYFDAADRRLIGLAEAGLMPAIVGCWGYYAELAGEDTVRRHWEYLIARYAALPVVWCTAGEALMPYYLNPPFQDDAEKEQFRSGMRRYWTDLIQHMRAYDPYERIITIHPTWPDASRDMVDDPTLIDLDWLQTGHGSFQAYDGAARQVVRSREMDPPLPVLNSEPNYEGIMNTNYHDTIRFVFWSNMLSGACGHTYGANGIWQMNGTQVPYGPSPHGASWGDTPWTEAYKLPGSAQVGYGKQLFAKYRWWEFAPHPEWVEEAKQVREGNWMAFYASGIPGEVRVFFLPLLGGGAVGDALIRELEPDVAYKAYYLDPVTGKEHDAGDVVPDSDGCWRSPRMSWMQDWVLVLERKE